MIPAGRRVRVLQIDPNANTPPYDRALASALAAAGCRIELLTSRFLYETLPPLPGVHLDERFFRIVGSSVGRRLGIESRPGLRRAFKAAEYPLDWALLLVRLAARRPDIVHVQWAVDPALDLAIWCLVRRLGVPLVYTVHNLVPHAARAGDAARFGRLYRAADGLIVHSQRSAVALRDAWGIPAERIAVAPHGPLLTEWPPIERSIARRQLGLPLDAELILFAGLIERYKGLGDLIAACSMVAERRPNARLVVAGKPNESFDEYQRQLADGGLLGRATLDLHFLPEERLAAYLCAADVVVLPYRAATSSGLLTAARRFGCAVVAADVGDLGELIVDGESGLLVPPQDPLALSAAIERLLVDPALAARLGAAGQRVGLGPHGWAEAARLTVDLYRRLLADRQRT
jgi:glycosyltransferase involved in cell wall biosynthesis